MRIISKSRLKKFWETAGYEDSEGPLTAWHSHVQSRTVSWRNWSDVKADFANASLAGNCVVFNIGGSKYRLVTRVLYPSQKVFILKVMTHKEYDKDKWKEECGCFEPPPQKEKKTPAKEDEKREAKPAKPKKKGR